MSILRLWLFRTDTAAVNVSEPGIVIIGAGAAGLMAAIAAGRNQSQLPVIALDGAAKIGAKILISGGGRCNVTHDEVHPADFYGSSRNAAARILRTFDVPATVAFFEELGVRLKREETGKLLRGNVHARWSCRFCRSDCLNGWRSR